jgi:hypothetical protein
MPGVVRTSTVVGLAASVAMHAGVVTWFVVAPPAMHEAELSAWSGSASGVEITLSDMVPAPFMMPESAPQPAPGQPAPPPPPPPKTPEPIEPEPVLLENDVVLGIDESDAPKDTPAFLGSNVPTEHQAPRSEVEQPALTTTPTGTSGPAVPSPAPAPSEGSTPSDKPSDATTPTPQSLPARPTLPAPPIEDAAPADAPAEPTGEGDESGPKIEPMPATLSNPTGDDRPLAEALPEDVFGTLVVVMPGGGVFVVPRAEVVARAGIAATTPAFERPAPEPTASAASGGPGNPRPGEVAGKESSPFTVKQTLEYRKNGKPLAPEGIEVTTFDPEISVLSSMTGTLRNPVIEMRFGSDGKVKSASFKNGQSSGRADWDQPILHAMHRWTIGGKKFRDLIEANPGREVIMTVRMILTK